MADYWLDIFWRWANIFKATGKDLKYWLGVLLLLLAIVAAYRGVSWYDKLEAFLKLWWVGAVGLGGLALYSAIRAFPQRDEELQGKIRQQTAEEVAAAARKQQLVLALREHQAAGVAIMQNIHGGSYVIPRHPDEIRAWIETVSTFIEPELPDHALEWRLPVQAIPHQQHPTEWQQAIHRLETLIGRIRAIIAALQNP